VRCHQTRGKFIQGKTQIVVSSDDNSAGLV
jgi:hypothetical protein